MHPKYTNTSEIHSEIKYSYSEKAKQNTNKTTTEVNNYHDK